eukprot:364284-Chlamydomonas_euryale.AAC.8
MASSSQRRVVTAEPTSHAWKSRVFRRWNRGRNCANGDAAHTLSLLAAMARQGGFHGLGHALVSMEV